METKIEKVQQIGKILFLYHHPDINTSFSFTNATTILQDYELILNLKKDNSSPFHVEDILKKIDPYNYESTQRFLRTIISSGSTEERMNTHQFKIGNLTHIFIDNVLNQKVGDYEVAIVLQELFRFDVFSKKYEFFYLVRCFDFKKCEEMNFQTQTIEIPQAHKINQFINECQKEENSTGRTWVLSEISHKLNIPDIYAEITNGAVTLKQVLDIALRQAFGVMIAPKLGIAH